jgi:hypothetical protein
MHIRNSRIALEFDEATGSLRQITDRTTGKRYLNDPRASRLVKLIVPTPDHNSRPLFSHLAGRPMMAASNGELILDFPELRDDNGKTGVFIAVRVRLPDDSPEAFFSLEIRNQGRHRVHEAWFPWIGGRRGRPGRTRDTVTTSKRPAVDIFARMARSAHITHSFGHHHLRWADDPISMLPMMDISDDVGGLSYIKYEQRPSPHVIVFENMDYEGLDEVCLGWSWATGCFVEPGQTWTSAEVGVGVHQGDWHDTADRLRAWAQTWRHPCNTPRAVREKIGLFHIQTHSFSGERYHDFAELPAVAKDAARFGVRDLMFWDYTASVYYRPDRGGFWEMPAARRRELKSALAEIRRRGSSVSAFVNWRLLSKFNSTWPSLKHLVQESLFGIGMYGFPPGTMDGGWYNDSAYEMGSYSVCCGADAYRPFANDLVRRTLDLGFDVLAVDQAAEWNYCLSRKHGHASPWEAWKRTYDWYDEVTRTVRARHRHAYTIAELPDLYNTQHIDLWWNWGWREHEWVRSDVFRYVLPPMIPTWCIDENQRDVIADAFATGCFMAIATRDMTGRLSDAPALAAHVQRLAALRKATAPFVAHGEFRDNRGLDVRGGKGYLYRSPAGLAVTLANGAKTSRKLQARVRADEGSLQVVRKAILHVEGAAPVPVTAKARGDALVFEATLPAYGAGVLTLE